MSLSLPGGARLAHLWESLRTSFWFLPTVMTAAAVGLSFASVHADELVKVKWIQAVGWIWAGSPEGARQVLSTIAGSMITIAGVAFSITIVALTLASTQFGPRLLRNFVRDLGNQVVLGTFVATFVYCLLVLRTVRGGDSAEFVPYLSVTLGVAFALASVGVLIYFIHHVAGAIQAEHLIALVGNELEATIRRKFPEELGDEDPGGSGEAPEPELEGEGLLVKGDRSGYVQAVDVGHLISVASEADLFLEVARVPGHFVTAGGALARAWPPGRVDGGIEDRIREAFIVGLRRTPTQDPEYAVHSLVEIGVRALSPGINDPFTAMTCLDWLGAALARLAGRCIPSSYHRDGQGRLRVIAAGTDFGDMADAAFNQLRQYGHDSVSVLLRLLDTIGTVAGHVRRAEDRARLRLHADKVVEEARGALLNQSDLREIEDRHATTMRIIMDKNRSG